MARSFYDEYEIPEEHEAVMRTMCRTEAGDPLPDKVRRKYIFVRWHADAANIHLSTSDLLFIVTESRYRAGVPKPEPDDVVTAWKAGALTHGADVECKWRNGTRKGVILGVTPDRHAIVRFNGEPDERKMVPSEVTAVVEETVGA